MRNGVIPVRRLSALLLAAMLLVACRDRYVLKTARTAAPIPRAEAVGGPPGYVGRWAPSASACTKDGWSFTTAGMESPGVLSCSFDKINPTDAGYTAVGVCTVGKAKAPGRLVMTLTGRGPSRSLTLNGGPFTEPVALARCPEEGTLIARSSETGDGG